MRIKLTISFLALLFAFNLGFSQVVGGSADFAVTWMPSTPCVGQPITFTVYDLSDPSNWVYGDWSFGDGSGGYGSSVTHSYATAGTYTLNVWAWDSLTGSFDTLSYSLTVDTVCSGVDLVSGNVYDDANGNGVKDGAETGVAGQLIEVLPGPYYVSTDINGDYTAYLTPGTYTLEWVATGYHTLSAPIGGMHTVTSTGSSATIGGNDFGIETIPGVQDLEISVYMAPPVPGFDRWISVYVYNNGTQVQNGTAVLTLDPSMTFLSATGGGTYSAPEVTWNFTGLLPGHSNWYSTTVNIPVSATLGDTMTISGLVDPIATDSVPSDNVDTLSRIVVGSYDPNDKMATPAGEGPTGRIDPSTSELNYRVRFQNTGTAPALTVVIRDTLAPELDLNNFHVTGSSHPMTWSIMGREAVFTFHAINLPDSTSDEPNSHGYVSFDIGIVPGLPLGTTIENSAGIYFDFNAPIITNTALNTLDLATDRFDPVEGQVLNAFPNPFTTTAIIRFENADNQSHDFSLYNASGQLVRKVNDIRTNEFRLERGNLPGGIYFFQMNSDKNLIGTGKLIIAD